MRYNYRQELAKVRAIQQTLSGGEWNLFRADLRGADSPSEATLDGASDLFSCDDQTPALKYYIPEHQAGYQRIRAEGKSCWDELFGPADFDNFSMRPIIEEALPLLHFSNQKVRVLEYGCGTGPATYLLVSLGFCVEAIDVCPTAIELARRFAADLGFSAQFSVRDICDFESDAQYDLVVDSYCLQCIVTDTDRSRVFDTVKRHIQPNGYYLIGTAIFEETRNYGKDCIFDRSSGIACDRIDRPDDFEDSLQIMGAWYLPNRRHLTPVVLVQELDRAGFETIWQNEHGNGLLCRMKR